MHAGRGAVTAVIGAALLVAAAVVLRARPGHRVGWVLGLLGHGVGARRARRVLVGRTPSPTAGRGPDLAVWFVARFGAFLLVGLPLLLVLYPTGRLMPGRWRTVSIAVIAAATGLPLALLVASDDVVFRDLRVPGVDTDWLTLPLPDGVLTGVLTVTRLLTVLALAAAVAVVVARHRRADGLERTQLRWLLWAGTVCVITVVVAVLRAVRPADHGGPGRGRAHHRRVGHDRHRPARTSADVDALVAGTLTYAGVAASWSGSTWPCWRWPARCWASGSTSAT